MDAVQTELDGVLRNRNRTQGSQDLFLKVLVSSIFNLAQHFRNATLAVGRSKNSAKKLVSMYMAVAEVFLIRMNLNKQLFQESFTGLTF